jgi:hypothetical protein
MGDWVKGSDMLPHLNSMDYSLLILVKGYYTIHLDFTGFKCNK